MENKQFELASKYLTYRSLVNRKAPTAKLNRHNVRRNTPLSQTARKHMKKVAKQYQEIYGTKLTASKATELLNVERNYIYYD